MRNSPPAKMTEPDSFNMKIAIVPRSRIGLVTERIASCRYTKTLVDRTHDPKISETKSQYRAEFLNILKAAMVNVVAPEQVIQNFVHLAETLHTSKALALHFENANHGSKSALEQIGISTFDDISEAGCTSLAQRMDLFDHPSICTGLLHPLSIALLAYRLGGPINAANTAFFNSWTVPEGILTQEQNFHIEGGFGNVLDDHRITLVWEMVDCEARAPSGDHSIFLSGDAIPRPLVLVDAPRGFEPTTVIYDSQKATLYYDYPNPKVVRRSINLDLHLNPITNEDLHLFSTASVDESDPENLTLARLLLCFPIVHYKAHFHRLLFSVESLNSIITKLSTLKVPRPKSIPKPAKHPLQQRFERYTKENQDHASIGVSSIVGKVSLSGTYSSPVSFRKNVWSKASLSVHGSLGADLMPQTALEESRESARKSIRDMFAASVALRLGPYGSVLLQQPYTGQDLLFIPELFRSARLIEQRCLTLIAVGFVDKVGSLASIAALAGALGNALNGPKEIHVNPEPRISGIDLQIFGARCLYLFWCSDTLASYLEKPEQGPCMTIDVKTISKEIPKVKLEIKRVADLLLRNWVAWEMLTEELPQGGFHVRRSIEEAL